MELHGRTYTLCRCLSNPATQYLFMKACNGPEKWLHKRPHPPPSNTAITGRQRLIHRQWELCILQQLQVTDHAQLASQLKSTTTGDSEAVGFLTSPQLSRQGGSPGAEYNTNSFPAEASLGAGGLPSLSWPVSPSQLLSPSPSMLKEQVKYRQYNSSLYLRYLTTHNLP